MELRKIDLKQAEKELKKALPKIKKQLKALDKIKQTSGSTLNYRVY